MLPQNRASTVGVPGTILSPDINVTNYLEDFEKGGVAIGNATQGLLLRDWRLWLDGSDVKLQADEDAPVVLFTTPGITELSLAFDQNMRPAIAYLNSEVMYLRWFDTVINAYRVDSFGVAQNPRLALDDKRPEMLDRSDIIMAYLRSGTLYYRQQRDRFTVERTLRTGLPLTTKLRNIGMGKNLRLQFEMV